MKLDFSGRSVLVTGATRGIGLQIATDFAALGAKMAITGRDTDTAEAAARALPGAGPHRAFAVDFSQREQVDRFLGQLGDMDRIDVCVNNAGINRLNRVDAITDDDWEALQAVNLEAPLRITRTVAKQMIAQRYGRIVNIASIFGVISKSKRALYSMTKFGLRGLTVAAAHDLAPFGILVNAVSPGFVRTELTERMLSSAEQTQLASQVPLGRFAEPSEISRVVAFLCSDLNTYLTAQNIVVDGGFVNV